MWAIVELLRLTGARVGEVVPIRTADVDRSGDVWVYPPRSHKTEDHGHDRVIVLGPRAIEVLRPWPRDDPEAFLFQPREAIRIYRAQARRSRVTPMTPSQRARKPKARPSKQPGESYTARAIHRSILIACRRAFPHPLLSRGSGPRT